MTRADLKLLTPWVARAVDSHRPEDQWEVVAPRKGGGKGKPQLVACMLEESDARAIANAWEALYALRRAVLDARERRGSNPEWLAEAERVLEVAGVPGR